MRYYQIIPIIKLPFGKAPLFTYFSKNNVPLGSLVEIEFSQKKIRGVVVLATTRPHFKTKEIRKIIHEGLLNNNQLELAKKISECYFTPLGVVLKFFIPKISKKIPPWQQDNSSLIKSKACLTPPQKKALEQIKNNSTISSLFGPASSGKTEIAMELARQYLKSGFQTLFLLPEIFLSDYEISRYLKNFGNRDIVLVHSRLKLSEMSLAWDRVRNNQAKIIIATRSGLFLPFKKLGLVVLDEHQDASYKQWDQSPRYHALEVSTFLQQIFSSKILLCSATPPAETLPGNWSRTKTQLVSLPMLHSKKISITKPKIILADLGKYFFKNRGRSFIISQELKLELTSSLEKNKISLILAPRSGMSKAVICQDCHAILKCKNCQLPMINQKESYRCLHCSYRIGSIGKCPSCGSFRLKNVGFGADKVGQELKHLFPQCRIEIANQDYLKTADQRRNLLHKITSGKVDILVGSTLVIKGLDLEKIDLVAILNADDWSGKRDYKYDENWLSNLFQLCGRLNRCKSDQAGKAVIQTFNPANPLLKYLQKWDWKSFLEDEINVRKSILFPPFCRLIKLSYKNPDKKLVEKQSEKLYNKLRHLEDDKIIFCYPPYYGYTPQIRNIWQKNLLIKIKDLKSTQLKQLLRMISKDWIIDLDPENIF